MDPFIDYHYLQTLLLKHQLKHKDLCEALGSTFVGASGRPAYNLLYKFGRKTSSTQKILDAFSELTEKQSGDRYTLCLVRVDKNGDLHIEKRGDE